MEPHKTNVTLNTVYAGIENSKCELRDMSKFDSKDHIYNINFF